MPKRILARPGGAVRWTHGAAFAVFGVAAIISAEAHAQFGFATGGLRCPAEAEAHGGSISSNEIFAQFETKIRQNGTFYVESTTRTAEDAEDHPWRLKFTYFTQRLQDGETATLTVRFPNGEAMDLQTDVKPMNPGDWIMKVEWGVQTIDHAHFETLRTISALMAANDAAALSVANAAGDVVNEIDLDLSAFAAGQDEALRLHEEQKRACAT